MNTSLNSFKVDTLDDLKKHKDISNHQLLEKVKNCAVNVLRFGMWTISIAFTIYIVRFLYLTSFTDNEAMITRMQDIIVKVSGWALFVLSQAGLIKRDGKNEEK
jgi:hypothetical protein